MHISTAMVHLEKFDDIIDQEQFIQGVVAPDVLGEMGDKVATHYGGYEKPNETIKDKFNRKTYLLKFLQNNTLNSDYNRGYFLHLVGDYYFFNELLYRPEFEEIYNKYAIYDDYAIVQKTIKEKYGGQYTPETQKWDIYQTGQLTYLEYDSLFHFIEFCGAIDLDALASLVLNNSTLPKLKNNT